MLSHVRLFATPWPAARQVPLCMEFSRQGSGLPFPPPGDLPDPGIEPGSPTLQADSPTLQADSLLLEPPGKPRKHRQTLYCWSHLGSPVNTRPPGNFPIFLLLCLLSVFLHWHVSPQGRGLCGLLGSLLCPQHFAWDLVYNRCSISSY